MQEKDFNLIMTSINDRIYSCDQHLGRISTTDDLKLLTIKEAQELKQFCVNEEQIMTKIAMVDVYHIIGMGDLKPTQMSQFIYKVKDYLQFRPTVKAIASNLESILQLPKIPVATKYKLLGLCNLTLTSNFEGEEDNACVEDYTALKHKSVSCIESSDSDTGVVIYSDELPYHLTGRTITVDLSRSAHFSKVLTRIFKCPMTEGNFLSRLQLKKAYGGIDWISDDNGIATGIVSAENNFKKLEAYFRNYSVYSK